ncbi:hypothetical protein CF326_g3140 [Tilletia indica]|nr:hypothetical protein CF326_g3140 [Tilletia indica]
MNASSAARDLPSSDDFPSDYDEETLRLLEPYIGRVISSTPPVPNEADHAAPAVDADRPPPTTEMPVASDPPLPPPAITSASTEAEDEASSAGSIAPWHPPSLPSSVFLAGDGDVIMGQAGSADAEGHQDKDEELNSEDVPPAVLAANTPPSAQLDHKQHTSDSVDDEVIMSQTDLLDSDVPTLAELSQRVLTQCFAEWDRERARLHRQIINRDELIAELRRQIASLRSPSDN